MSQENLLISPVNETAASAFGKIQRNTTELFAGAGYILTPSGDATGATDSVNWQAAFDVMSPIGGTVRAKSGTYYFDTTISVPSVAAAFRLCIVGDSYATRILWVGSAGSSVFHTFGWSGSEISGITVSCNNVAGITAWDLDTDNDAGSSSHLTFRNCTVELGTGGDCIGWRCGKSEVGGDDFSFNTFLNCMVAGSRTAGDYGWLVMRGDALNWTWVGGCALGTYTAFSNRNPYNVDHLQNGGASMYFYGFGTSGSQLDFDFRGDGVYGIYGGRFEEGRRFIYAGSGGATYSMNIIVSGAHLGNYAPSDGVIVLLQCAAKVKLENTTIGGSNAGDYTADMITIENSVNCRKSVTTDDCLFQAAEPFYTISGSAGTVRRIIHNCWKCNLDTTIPSVYSDVDTSA